MKPGIVPLGTLAVLFALLQLLWIGLIIKNGKEEDRLKKDRKIKKYGQSSNSEKVENDRQLIDQKKRLEKIYKR
tara:strand:+ start:18 stop:239 length:222 start_codon:yes stop_codon:yes gene_type:complete